MGLFFRSRPALLPWPLLPGLLLCLGCAPLPADTPDVGNDAGLDADDAGDADEPDDESGFDPWLRDAEGRVVLLRGTNLGQNSKHSPNNLPTPEAAQYERLREEVGLNALRFLVYWQAIEPEQGVYDQDYLAGVRSHIEAATEAGLLVMVDMHQDVFGVGFGHSGAPRWACDEALYASFTPPSNWFEGYFSDEVKECFDRFWHSVELQDAFAAAWAQLAGVLGDLDGVIAYDLLNEPFFGTQPLRPFEEEILPAFYARVSAAIRAADPYTYIAVEPAPAANLGAPTRLRIEGARKIYAPHAYVALLETGQPYDLNPTRFSQIVAQIKSDATRLERPLVIGEFGVGRYVEHGELFLRDALHVLDTYMVSALHWDASPGEHYSYGLWTTDLQPTDHTFSLARPFPERINGEPFGWSWDVEAGRFELHWQEDPDLDAPTIVSLPTLAFPDGAVFELDGSPQSQAITQNGSRLYIAPEGAERQLIVTRQ